MFVIVPTVEKQQIEEEAEGEEKTKTWNIISDDIMTHYI